jgi:ketosteroid isomerase-like protein
VACGALAGCSDDSSPDAVSASSTTVAAASTTSATVKPAELQPVQVARDFLDAYSNGDADRALTYLTEDSTGGGYTNTYWASPETFRLDVAMAEAQHIEEMFTGCEEQGDSAAGTTVRCTFDMHAYSSDDVGRGPYSGNYWDVVVRDGKITSAVATWDYIRNGVSSEMWAPFQAWVTSTHPEDVQVMYSVAGQITDEAIRLWDERLSEWAATVNSSSQ